MALNDRHQPKSYNDLVIPTELAQDLIENYIISGDVGCPGHLLLYGPYGTGKSQAVRIIGELLLGDDHNNEMVEKSGTEFKTAGQVDGSIRPAVSVVPLSANYRVLIVNELDAMLGAAQKELRVLMDKYGKNTAFMFSANDIGNVDGGVQDRCLCVNFGYTSAERWLPRARDILRAEGIKVPDEALLELLRGSGGSVRKVFRNLEMLLNNSPKFTPQSIPAPTPVIVLPAVSIMT